MNERTLLKTLSGEPLATPPMWLMRQAGRYLPEYMAIRGEAGDFLTMCYTPDYAAEVTLQPIRRFDLDAAIIFSDILVIPHALGQDVNFVKGEGPNLGKLDIKSLSFDIDHLNPVFEALQLVRVDLPESKTLIGFCGAPWTVACYMIEGKGSKDWEKARRFAYAHPDEFQALIDILVQASAEYLIRQIEAGADVLQIFDSWSGALSEDLFEKYTIQPIKQIIQKVRAAYPNFPIIGFPRGAGAKIGHFVRETGVTAVSLDTSVPMNQAKSLQNLCLVQGNLDPVALLTGGDMLKKAAHNILKNLNDKPFIFNLGHGVIKETPPEHVVDLVKIVRDYER